MKNELPNNHGLYENVIENRHLMPRDGDNISITDIQYDALAAGVARGADLLISAPTSTGKTLIGWWAVCSALNAGARVVYLVSYRALAHQKFEEVQRLFLGSFLGDDRSSITCATGDGVEDASGRKTNAPLSSRILIATYEKFLGCLSTGGPPVDLTDICFICDEVQLIGEKNRGQNVELLLTLLKKTGWRQFIGLSAVLDDPDAQALADWLNLNLVRNPDREKQITIECRVSEKNIEFISKPQESPVWRENTLKKPQNLSTSYIVETLSKHSEHRPVIVFCMRVADTFDLAEEVGMNRSSSIQVDVPNGWDIDLSLLGLLGKRIAYHNAELSEEERLFVEMRLAAGQVEIVFATSTLAAGVNFPLGSAVFSSWKRWNFDRRRHELIGRAEFQNMAGRVGRMGQATSNGLVIMTASNERELGEAKYLMDFERHDQLESGIAPEDFGPLVLQIIAGKLCGNRDQVFDLLRSTLSAAREISRNADGVNYWRPYMDRQIDRLIALGCIIETPYRMTATTLGEVVARSGLKPETAIYFIDGFSKFGAQLTEMLPSGDSEGNEDDFGFILSHAALASPEYGLMGGAAARRIPWRISDSPLVDNPPARKLSSLLFSQPWMGDRGAANGALLLLLWFSGSPRKDIEGCVSGVRLGTVQTMARDVSWVLNGISEVLAAITSPALAEESKPPLLRDPKTASIVRRLVRAVKRQAARISTGLPGKALWLTNLDLQQRP
ncbi:DEAD/DEAH box helicase [Acetobacter cerevisiae]|uniref:DEAD/DEAH box helicase n=1 Tax=Acetobacter cerevisiae TaxID=178900 RepID=UPI000A6F154A|nr:DEAD/DEAH box helicase [Acetobacter cerevisiae]